MLERDLSFKRWKKKVRRFLGLFLSLQQGGKQLDNRLAMGQDPDDDRNEGSDQRPNPVAILVDFSAEGSDLVHDGLDEIFIARDLPDDELQEGRLLRHGWRGSGDGASETVSAQEVLEAREGRTMLLKTVMSNRGLHAS